MPSNRIQTTITSAMILFMLSACMLSSNGLAQSSFRLGGSVDTSIEALFFDNEAPDLHGDATLRVQAQSLTFPTRLFVDGRVIAHGAFRPSDDWKTSSQLDRLYVRHYFPTVDLTIGKQFVNWGVGYAFSPTDLFHPPDPLNPDRVRPGILAAIMQIPTGPLDYWSVALAEEKYAVRRRAYTGGTDWSIVALSDREGSVIGLDAKRDVGVGLVAAAAYRMPGNDVPTPSTPTLEGLIGADYSWMYGSLVWVGEYAFQWTKKASFQHQTFQQLTYTFDEFTSLSGALLADFSTASTHWTARLHTALGPQSQLSLALHLPSYGASSQPSNLPVATFMVQLTYMF